MIFTEEAAKTIAAEHNIPQATIVTWRHRNKIPDKYLRSGYSKPIIALTEAEKLRIQKLCEVLKSKELNKAAYKDLVSYPSKINDVLGGKSTFSEKEVELLTAKINELRAMISGLLRDDRKFLDSYQRKLMDVLHRPEVVVTHTLNLGNLSKEEYTQVRGVLDGRSVGVSSIALVDKITNALQKLYVLIQL